MATAFSFLLSPRPPTDVLFIISSVMQNTVLRTVMQSAICPLLWRGGTGRACCRSDQGSCAILTSRRLMRRGLSLVSWVGPPVACYLAEAFMADGLRAGAGLGGAIMVMRALSRD